MKTRMLLWVVIALLPAGAAFAAGGVLTNADFKTRVAGNQKLPAGWVLDDLAKALYSSVNDDGYNDADALHYRGVAGKPAGRVAQTVTCQANADYVITAALKSDGTCKPRVQVFARDLERPVVSLIAQGDKAWKVHTARFNSGAATRLEVQLYGDQSMTSTNQAVAGFAAFDDVQIYAAAEAPKELTGGEAFVPPGPNVALGKPYTFRVAPNYGLCADPGDKTQLTDGEYSVGYFWAQKTTVGWQNAAPVVITLDLGKIEPIAGLSYNAAAGRAGVSWPNNLLILVSDDGQRWSTAGDLIQLAAKQGLPAADVYAIHRFATGELKAHGRYVQLYVDAAPYIFVDEIEVYRGPDSLLATPPGELVNDPVRLFERMRVRNAMVLRLRTDLGAARQAIAAARHLSAPQRADLTARADKLAAAIEAMPEVDPQMEAILPLNDIHAGIYALSATLHRARGLSGVVAWQNNRWDPLDPTQGPAEKPRALPALSVAMMSREYRAETFNLTNATDEAMSVTVNVTGLPGGRNPDYLSVREVLWTDTREMRPIAAALPEAGQGPLGYRLTLPAGMTRQVWLQFRPTDVPAGEYRGEIAVVGGRGTADLKLPLSLKLYPFEFPAWPSISIGGWDYLNGPGGAYDANPRNLPALLKSLTEHYVDTPWAQGSVQPNDVKFDPEGKLLQAKFDHWDEWVGKWPGARYYAVFLAVRDSFYGEPMGTPRFNRMVGEWLTAWVEHMKTQELKPEQLVLLPYDEPSTQEGAEIIIKWGQAINAAQPRVTLFEDPTFRQPSDGDPAMYEVCDILCPNLPMALEGGKTFQDFYLGWKQRGKTLWLYSCSGPAKLLDPIYYHRSQFWWALRLGATGSFYWAFGDEAGASSFKPYLQTRAAYSPLFLTEDRVVEGKHLAAIREGAQDFEYFAMLRTRVAELEAKGSRSPLVAEAKRLLTDLPLQVTAPIVPEKLSWPQESDRGLMDRGRVQVLEMLSKLAKL